LVERLLSMKNIEMNNPAKIQRWKKINCILSCLDF
jgi:hypothetical protein